MTVDNVAYSVENGALAKVSEAYAEAEAITEGFDVSEAAGAKVSAKYVYVNDKAYFVLDFDLANVEADVTGLKYQNRNVALYKAVQFAEDDIITADAKHALHAFYVKDGSADGVASVNATVTAVRK